MRNAYKSDSLLYHEYPVPGKLSVVPTKPLHSVNDLSLAYSPGVSFPCEEIAQDSSLLYKYTNKGNSVAVVSNGTAVLGLGNIGSRASKPVMEGKAALFKRFSGIDAVDLQIDSPDPEVVIKTVSAIGETFGGINLEDIKSPDSFFVEKEIQKNLTIPVFHDDQHGTAVVVAAALLNAAHILQKDIKELRCVLCGAGAAGIAVLDFLVNSFGLENYIALDRQGVIHELRDDLDEYKGKFAVKTDKRSLENAMEDSDVFIGLSTRGILTKKHVLSMSKDPIIFCLANPEPEMYPDDIKDAREDAIIATGRSDYPNQVNNLLCFPFLFRVALDTQSPHISKGMMSACSHALAELAREKNGESSKEIFGYDYIIPSVFDEALLSFVSSRIAEYVLREDLYKNRNFDFGGYKDRLRKLFVTLRADVAER